VASIDDTLAKITAAGGRMVKPKEEVGGMGYYGYAADSEGNVIGLWEDIEKA
jgi:predicted enzyme related to lactoylglutathione lyase